MPLPDALDVFCSEVDSPQALRALPQSIEVGLEELRASALKRAHQAVRDRSPALAIQGLALVVLALLGFLLLLAIDYALTKGLWGELIFALVVASLLIWLAGRALPYLGIQGPRLLQAPFWAALLLVGLPLAIISRPAGIMVLSGVLLLSYTVIAFVRWTPPPLLQPAQWFSAGLAVAAVLVFVWVHGRREEVPTPARSPPVPGAAALALRYRPFLFFDTDEQFIPLDIERAMADGNLEQCRYAVRRPDCQPVANPSELDASYDFLRLHGDVRGSHGPTGGLRSAYYYHVTGDSGSRVYIDYWWYYAQNPLPIGKHVLCGPGMRISEISCFEHPADWEGITVVLEAGELVSVHYAQHRDVVSYSWSRLERLWAALPTTGKHPRVYVALDSHASYPLPCRSGCGLESHYDGLVAWGNNGAACGKACVKPVPVDAKGAADLWNAFPGPWGYRRCILLGAYCDVSPAPRAPAFQGRYRHPGHADRIRS